MKSDRFILLRLLLLIGLVLTLPVLSYSTSFPLAVVDVSKNSIYFSQKPQRVVCLVPYITEILLAFGQERAIMGLTYQDLTLKSALRKKNVGSYFRPDIEVIAGCHPDLIIAAPSQKRVISHYNNTRYKLMVMEVKSIEEAFTQMGIIGKLFDCENKAKAVIKHNRDQLDLIKAKLAGIPIQDRKRVTRVMAKEELFCPGDDSFQNEMIEAAGGIVPHWGKTGFAVPVELIDWQKFNPQVIYGCHLNETDVKKLLSRKGWKEVDAVRNGFVTMFPCDLTCQVSTRVGDFVHWLAAVLYLDIITDPEKVIHDDIILEQNPLSLNLPYVENASVVKHLVADEQYKSLVVRFKNPQKVLSTIEGYLSGISAVSNTLVPMPASLGHMAFGADKGRMAIRDNLGFTGAGFTTLMTGADMDNLSVKTKTFNDISVTALVTSGIRGNAMRMSKDSGDYIEHGTINVIVMANRQFTPGAMAGAIISATEAKSAALSDLDIRSTYTPWENRATGTGTDSLIVVQGQGPLLHYAGGHTKTGELIARAVYEGVTEAIYLQNGVKADRDIFQRLAERKISLDKVVEIYTLKTDKKILVPGLETLLADSYYASFIESALAISDEYQKGLVKDLDFFDSTCSLVAQRISGRSYVTLKDIPSTGKIPLVMKKAFGALLTGIAEKEEKRILQ